MINVNTKGTRVPARRGQLLLTAAVLGCGLLAAGCSSYNANVSEAVKAAKLSPEGEGRGLLLMANRFAAQGNHGAAIPLYRELAGGLGGGDEAKLGLGKSLAAIGQYAESVKVLDFATGLKDSDPVKADAMAALGVAQLGLGNSEAAGAVFAAAARSDPNHAGAASGVAVAAAMAGDHEKASATLDKAIAANPDNVQLKANKGLSLALNDDTSGRAISLLEEVVKSPGSTARHRQNLALAYAFAGEQAKARKMASVDLGADEVSETMGFFNSLKGMDKSSRMTAVVDGQTAPKTTIDEVANLRVDDGGPSEAKARAVRRIIDGDGNPIEVDDKGLPPKMDSKGWAVQVAAYRTANELIPGWTKIKAKLANLIGHLMPRRSEIDFGVRNVKPSGKFYRLNAGPLANKAEAVALCKRIAKAHGECWVRPPEADEGTRD